MRTGTKLMLGAGIVALGGLLVWGLAPRPVPVETAEVSRGPFERTLVADGRTRVRERYLVAAPLAGRLARIALEPGDAVRRGQVVAMLEPLPPAMVDARGERELGERVAAAQSGLARAGAEAARASAELAQAKSDAAREERLADSGYVSPARREQLLHAVEVAGRALEAARHAETAARHDLEQARAALARYAGGGTGARWPVMAPVAGTVLRVVQKSEGPVAAGTVLLELGDPTRLEAIVDALSQEAVAVAAGMSARLLFSSAGAPVEARVRGVEPSAFTKVSALGIEEQRVNVLLDFAAPPGSAVGDGWRVEARIVVERIENAAKVPVGALVREPGGAWTVFAVEGGRTVRRTVTLRGRNGTEAAIAEGLAPGAKVVLYPPDRLREGERVVQKERKN